MQSLIQATSHTSQWLNILDIEYWCWYCAVTRSSGCGGGRVWAAHCTLGIVIHICYLGPDYRLWLWLVLWNDPSVSQSVFTIMEKAPTRAFSWSESIFCFRIRHSVRFKECHHTSLEIIIIIIVILLPCRRWSCSTCHPPAPASGGSALPPPPISPPCPDNITGYCIDLAGYDEPRVPTYLQVSRHERCAGHSEPLWLTCRVTQFWHRHNIYYTVCREAIIH